MNKMRWTMALLLTTVVGIGGCAHESGSVSDPHPVTAADLQAVLRDEWSRHLFWVRNVVLDHAKNDLRSRDFAEKAVTTNAKEIARTFKSFYGEPASYRLNILLTQHYEAVKAYSLATVAGNKRQQDAAMAQSASNIEEIASFLSGTNPHLSKEAVRSLFAAHVDHLVNHINKLQEKDYAGEEEAWPAMEHHVYVIADTLAAAVVKQFPKKFM
jgi:hypothetical protein